jgi:hypothetical protein
MSLSLLGQSASELSELFSQGGNDWKGYSQVDFVFLLVDMILIDIRRGSLLF